MEYAGLISAVVDIVSGAGRAAAESIGASAGSAVSDLVRARLGTTEEGRTALAGVDADPTATDGLRSALRDALATDPDFAGQLAEALADPPPATPIPKVEHSVVISGGSKVRNSTISLGPLTISQSRGGYAVAALLAVAVAVLAFQVIRGGTEVLDRNDPAQQAEPVDLTAVLTEEQTRAVLPDIQSLPSGWIQDREPTTPVCDYVDCEGVLATGDASYVIPGVEHRARFRVIAYSSLEAARRGYTAGREAEEANIEAGEHSWLTLPAIGDESVALQLQDWMSTAARVGTIMVAVDGFGGDSERFDPATLEALTRMMAERAQQAQNGETPTAAVTQPLG
ncbi:hypothetical protein [Streptomyces hainanensis]|uniref:Uncharacterized protein n=1 Tax=Streptomyces hainanensis TaxID=402648 RepID=A0A4R4TMD9_9ACTN|nr:hypothetical protein [Streptomyces hainanensis]TDC75229.1 hypothetical protein E1283_13165 [Streptomyces hainanensis]